jgi:hypothetical protein
MRPLVRRLIPTVVLVVAAGSGCGGDDDAGAPQPAKTAPRTSTSAPATFTPTRATPVSPSAASPTATPPLSLQFGRCISAPGCPTATIYTFRERENCCADAINTPGVGHSWCPEAAVDDTTQVCSQCAEDPCAGLVTPTPTPTPI